MSRRLIKTILVLVSMLFLNIEATQAGLLGKLRLYIAAEMPPWQLAFITCGTLGLLFFLFVIFTPLQINDQRWSWYNYFTYHPEKSGFANKKQAVGKISRILAQKRKA